MIKTNVGSSTNSDVLQTGAEAAAKAKEGLTDIKLAIVNSSVDYDQKLLLDSVKSELGGVPVIGNTSFTGVITPEGYISGDDGFVSVFLLAGGLTVGVSGDKKGESARQTGIDVAKKALENAGKNSSGKITPPDYFFMVANPGEEEFFLKGVSEIIGRVPYFGGSAADNSIEGKWSLYTGDVITPEGGAVAFVWADEPGGFANVFTGAYDETENFGVITKVKNNRTLVEIDGEPAIKKYAQWRNMPTEKLMGGDLLVETIVAPLGVKDRLGELTAIRHPMFGNDDLSMNIGANLAEKTVVIQMDASVDKIIRAAGETVEEVIRKLGKKPSGLHLVHCGGRRAAIADRIDEVYTGIKAAAGDIPFIVEFTFGEYGYFDDGNNTTGGLMLSFTAFA